jgi:O-succinylbenzoic acid--CoA ligase
VLVEAWLPRAARLRPDWTALECPDGARTYAQLHAAALSGAGALAREGVAPGDRVALALPPGSVFAEALHACLLLGAVAVPVDLRLSPAERARVCEGAALVVTHPLALPAAAHERTQGLDLGHDLDAVAAIIHTSGTTSQPRPIELTYGNLLWSALGSAVALGLDPRERWLCALPVSHVGGLSILVRCAIYATTAVVHPRFDTDRVLHALTRGEITLVSLVATTLARLLDAGLARPTAGSAGGAPLRHALTGGGPVPAALIARARQAGVPVTTTYGLTEAASQVTTGGPPLFCTRVRIARPQTDGPWTDRPRTARLGTDGLRAGELDGDGPETGAGEILVAGPTVAPGSREADGWLHTGDLGALDARGFLSVTGRLADTIVSGGENVAPAEVEAVLEAHPDVLEAAVLARADPEWGEAIAAIVRTRPGALRDAQALRAHCAAHLARYKVPKQLHFAERPLPRTASGKLLRRSLT